MIPASLWESVRNNYEKRDFTGAILDACYFLSELIRQKSGLDGDGAPLIGQALGGTNLKIRIARDQSESEQNTQKGIESLLRGFYQAIRNPRSHKKIMDGAEDATSIIAFCGYLVRQIEQARAPASKQELVKRVLDPDFVPQKRYAELLVEEMPPGLKMDIFLELYEQRKSWISKSMQHFNAAIMEKMTDHERKSIIELISDDLKTADDDTAIQNVLSSFPGSLWEEVSEVARLRIENRIIRSLGSGRYDSKARRCLGGAMATWTRGQFPYFLSKRELISALYAKFSSRDHQERDYALEFFIDILSAFPKDKLVTIDRLFTRKLKEGIAAFHDPLLFSPWDKKHWSSELDKAYDAFVQKKEQDEEDEIPF
jgi:uncharacterized protein (TIGR02391 family)